MDCIEGMAQLPDKYFELAIVDPPYGDCGSSQWDKKERGRFGRFDKYKITRTGGTWSQKYQGNNDITHWDIAPTKEYFDELFRISKNQIIWGGNYFGLPPNRCFIVWYKLGIPLSFTMSNCEYAWASFWDNAKCFTHMTNGFGKRFHPTQKPIGLYIDCLRHFSNPGDKILDTHAGSGSCLIAAPRMGLEWIGFEIDEDYHRQAQLRIERELAKGFLFNKNEDKKLEQKKLFFNLEREE